VEVQLHAFLVSTLEGGPGIHWIGGRVGSRAGLDAVVKTENPCLTPAGNVTPVYQLVAYSLY